MCFAGLVVADGISYAMHFYDGRNLSRPVLRQLVQLALANQKGPELRFPLHAEFIQRIHKKASDQWTVILSAVSAFQ